MGSTGQFGSLRHLAGRFFGALSPAGPPPGDERWATGWLLPGERELWARMSGPDRRHAVGVARGTLDQLGTDEPGPEVVASALLHDVGKIESDLGTFARVGVTLLAMALGRTRLVRSTQQQGLQAKIRLYLTHDRVGADLLRRAGSHDLTVSWAEQHHLPPDRWTVEPRLAHALKTADGD